jgi:hypothetical protein
MSLLWYDYVVTMNVIVAKTNGKSFILMKDYMIYISVLSILVAFQDADYALKSAFLPASARCR